VNFNEDVEVRDTHTKEETPEIEKQDFIQVIGDRIEEEPTREELEKEFEEESNQLRKGFKINRERYLELEEINEKIEKQKVKDKKMNKQNKKKKRNRKMMKKLKPNYNYTGHGLQIFKLSGFEENKNRKYYWCGCISWELKEKYKAHKRRYHFERKYDYHCCKC